MMKGFREHWTPPRRSPLHIPEAVLCFCGEQWRECDLVGGGQRANAESSIQGIALFGAHRGEQNLNGSAVLRKFATPMGPMRSTRLSCSLALGTCMPATAATPKACRA